MNAPSLSMSAVRYALLLARLGQNEQATHLTEATNRFLRKQYRQPAYENPRCSLVLADLACDRHDLNSARQRLTPAHEWAVARDNKERLCLASKVRAKIALDAHDWKAARDAVEDGLRIARDCGFGLYHIDLMILRGRVALAEGDVEGARDDVDVALSRGVRPEEGSGLPVLLAATDPECGYVWGEEDGRALLEEIEEVEASTDLPIDEASRRESEKTRLAPEQDGFDVFLCHNSQDKAAVEEIARTLQGRGLRPWLDRWELRPGLPWQKALEEQIATIGAAAVFVGPTGEGPWHEMELNAFLQQFVKRRCPVVPVILPGVEGTPELPAFLDLMTRVDFRQKDPDPVDQLIWGITGDKPGP